MPTPKTQKPIPDLMASMSSFSALNEQSLWQVRKTAENPPRMNAYDVMQAVAGVQPHHCSTVFKRLQNDYPEINTACVNYNFGGRGPSGTPVADARGITEIIMVLPSKAAAHFRKSSRRGSSLPRRRSWPCGRDCCQPPGTIKLA